MSETASEAHDLSFRLRLTLFFVLIVVLPMIALAILVSQIADDSASGKTDARLDAGLRTAANLYDEAQRDAARAAHSVGAEIADDPQAAAALASGPAAVESLARGYVGRHGVVSLRLDGPGGATASAGDRDPVASASSDLVGADGAPIGTVRASTSNSKELLARIERLTGERAALVGSQGPVAGAAPLDAEALPQPGDSSQVEVSGDSYRIAASEPLGPDGTRIAVLAPAEGAGFLASEPTMAVVVAGFFAIALIAVLLIFRSLQGYVREMLGAARRIGGGDFSSKVPVAGRDEMAGLASEFNRMSGRLSDQMDDLRRQRVEIERSVRRIGEAFASGLDRGALLAIVVETAVAACEADYGLVALSGHVGAEAEAGQASEASSDVALAAERRALRKGQSRRSAMEPSPSPARWAGSAAPSDRSGQ